MAFVTPPLPDLLSTLNDLSRPIAARMRAIFYLRTLGGSADGVDVVFFDIARHDWSTGGVLWSDKGAKPAPQPLAGSA
jgi:phenylpyruvate tautomerase PptA (4-oxalocrotonate tautomerase family)